MYANLTEFQDRELGNLMWSLAVLDHRPTWILELLLLAAADNFSGGQPDLRFLARCVGSAGQSTQRV